MADIKNWTKIALWELFDGSKAEQSKIRSIIEPMYQTREFFASLEPYPGIVDTIHDLETTFDIHFCTKPSKYPCDSEGAKRETVTKHFGPQYAKKVIMTHDKTLVRWTILVDDNPHITWVYKKNPEWKQVLVDQAHNQESSITRLSIDNLGAWKKKLEEIESDLFYNWYSNA